MRRLAERLAEAHETGRRDWLSSGGIFRDMQVTGIGGWQQVAGNRWLATGGWQQVAGNRCWHRRLAQMPAIVLAAFKRNKCR